MRLEYFHLIDRVEAVDTTAGTIRASAQVPVQSTIFEGHFPGYPILPGVLMIESMAQTGGNLVLVLENFQRMPFPDPRLRVTMEEMAERIGFPMKALTDG